MPFEFKEGVTMAVLKNKTQGNYTIVSQNIMHDKDLSLTERGMLLTLLSLPDNWHLTIMGLCQILPDGKDRISRTLNSLIDKGYVTREAELKEYYRELESAAAGLDSAKAIRDHSEPTSGIEQDVCGTGLTEEAGQNPGSRSDTETLIREVRADISDNRAQDNTIRDTENKSVAFDEQSRSREAKRRFEEQQRAEIEERANRAHRRSRGHSGFER